MTCFSLGNLLGVKPRANIDSLLSGNSVRHGNPQVGFEAWHTFSMLKRTRGAACLAALHCFVGFASAFTQDKRYAGEDSI